MGKKTSFSIVKNNHSIRNALKSRFKELKLKLIDIGLDAKERNATFDSASLSKYLSNKKTGGISEENVIWLCVRYGVKIQFLVGDKTIVNGEEKYVLNPYNEETALELLKTIFPSKWKKNI